MDGYESELCKLDGNIDEGNNGRIVYSFKCDKGIRRLKTCNDRAFFLICLFNHGYNFFKQRLL